MDNANRDWPDRKRWAAASVVPPVIMIFAGAITWPVGILHIIIGVYLILIIQKARREIRTDR